MQTCDLTGTLVQMDGTPMAFADLVAYLDAPLGHPGVLWSAESTPGRLKVSTTSARDGTFTFTLAQGACMMLKLPGVETPIRLLVPSVSTARLVDYLYPRLASIDWAQLVDNAGELEIQDIADQSLITLASGGTVNIILRANFSNGTESVFDDGALEAAPDPGYLVIQEQALAITQAAAGDVVVSHTSDEATLSADHTGLPVFLLPEADFDIALPSDLTVRFT